MSPWIYRRKTGNHRLSANLPAFQALTLLYAII